MQDDGFDPEAAPANQQNTPSAQIAKSAIATWPALTTLVETMPQLVNSEDGAVLDGYFHFLAKKEGHLLRYKLMEDGTLGPLEEQIYSWADTPYRSGLCGAGKVLLLTAYNASCHSCYTIMPLDSSGSYDPQSQKGQCCGCDDDRFESLGDKEKTCSVRREDFYHLVGPHLATACFSTGQRSFYYALGGFFYGRNVLNASSAMELDSLSRLVRRNDSDWIGEQWLPFHSWFGRATVIALSSGQRYLYYAGGGEGVDPSDGPAADHFAFAKIDEDGHLADGYRTAKLPYQAKLPIIFGYNDALYLIGGYAPQFIAQGGHIVRKAYRGTIDPETGEPAFKELAFPELPAGYALGPAPFGFHQASGILYVFAVTSHRESTNNRLFATSFAGVP